jgi:hypothetical protein
MQQIRAKEQDKISRTRKTLLVLVLLGTLCAGCEVWNIEKGLKQVGYEIVEAESLGMEEAALYHLNVARSLLAAARKQYEEADFAAARQFLDQSQEQLQRAQGLHALRRTAPPPEQGEAP